MSSEPATILPDSTGSGASSSGSAATPALRSRTIRNVLANWLGVIAETGVSFLLTPFLIWRLGTENYGLWIFIGSLAGYLGVLDFGLRGAIGRYVAYYRGQCDQHRVLQTINTALLLLAALGAMAALLMALLAMCLHYVVALSPEQLAEARTALLIVGLQLGLFIPLATFDAVLWGHERFDLMSIADCLAAALRGIGAATVVAAGFGLIGLAWVTLAVTITSGVVRLFICVCAARPFRLSPRYVDMSIAREITPYGFWNFLVSLSTVGRRQLNPILIGALLGPAALTPYSVATRLITYASVLLAATVGVLTPTMTVLVGKGDVTRQRQMVFRLGRITTAYSIYSVCVLTILSRSLLDAWIGPEVSGAWVIVALLAIGEFLPMCVQPYADAVLALGKQRPVAWRGWAEVASGLALSALLAPMFGLAGVAAAFAGSATLFRGVFMLQYGGRLTGFGTREYLVEILFPLLIRSAVPGLLLALVSFWYPPLNVAQIAMYTVGFTSFYSVAIASAIPEFKMFVRSKPVAVSAEPEMPC